jgi:hypothetical protein
MTLEERIARLFRMDEKARRRHSNPWSVYSRFSLIPLLGIAFWSRVWFGWWSLIPIIVVLLWGWLNPRVFPEPKSTNNWASKAVLGEWVWMNRKKVPVPNHHRNVPNALSAAGALGIIPFIWGLIILEVWPVVFGGAIIIISKLWFVDRMVWLYEDMKDATPEYKSWLY